jgi:hypothetical protein
VLFINLCNTKLKAGKVVNLLGPGLRSRDIRKLVESNMHEVMWDAGGDETSEWILAAFEERAPNQKLEAWFKSKGISESEKILVADAAWSEIKRITWGEFQMQAADYFGDSHLLIIGTDRTWLLEYHPLKIARFGRWFGVN